MQVELQLIISAGTVLVGIGGSYAVIKYRLDRDEKEDDKKELDHEKSHDTLFALVREIKQQQSAHEKESSQIRLDYERRFGEHGTTIEVTQTQYAEILKRLDGIDRKIGKIEDNQDK